MQSPYAHRLSALLVLSDVDPTWQSRSHMESINGDHIPIKMLTAARCWPGQSAESVCVSEDFKEFGLFWALPLQQNDFHLFPALQALSIM